MGQTYAEAGDHERAYEFYHRSIKISSVSGDRTLLSETLDNITELAEKDGKYREALAYYRRYTSLKDSLSGEETTKNIDRLRIEFESERKEQENKALIERQSAQEKLLTRNRTIIALCILFIVVLLFMYHRIKRANKTLADTNIKVTVQRDEIEEKNRSLEDAIKQIKTLSGLLPICANCKKIRSDDGYWEDVEGYISKHSDAMFSHGICPDCMNKLYPDYIDKINEKKHGERRT